MAKKTKRKVSAVQRPSQISDVATMNDTPAPAVASSSTGARSFARRTAVVQEFNPDYTYVVKDLKRIGTLAGTFFVLLVALSFILPIILPSFR